MTKQPELPTDPSYQQACDLLDDFEHPVWIKVVQQIAAQQNFELENYSRIKEGGNALFQINDDWILKIVPPNWSNQAQAEIDSLAIIPSNLSMQTPTIVGSGKYNNWHFVIFEKMAGNSLADYWEQLDFEQKNAIIKQLGIFIKELHNKTPTANSPMKVDWQKYCKQLQAECVERHQRKGLAPKLVAQIEEYLGDIFEHCDDGEDVFIHMDFHPWNLMAEKSSGMVKLSGALDFGDAIIGRSKLLELNTPALFLCQGDKRLFQQLLKNYGLTVKKDQQQFQKSCMVMALLRPACDFNFVLSQVPETGPRENWEQIAQQLFPV